jgi:hypothetical protein
MYKANSWSLTTHLVLTQAWLREKRSAANIIGLATLHSVGDLPICRHGSGEAEVEAEEHVGRH